VSPRTELAAWGCVLAFALSACSTKDLGTRAPTGAVLTGSGSSAGSTSGGLSTSGSAPTLGNASSSGATSLGASGSGASGASGASSTGASASGGPSASGAGSASGGTGTDARDPDIVSILANLSADRISQSIQTLAGFGTRSSCSPQTAGPQGIVAARDWLKAQFDGIAGLKTSLYPYAQTRCIQSFTRHNVIALIPGATHPERIVVVGSHYDSRTIDVTDGTSPAPGANDSGSQTALVLELARAFVGHSFDATVAFIAFAGEEQGMVGSGALSKDMGSVVPNGQVVAMLQSDIVGGDKGVNDATTLQQFRLYSPGTPREVGATTPDGTPDDTSPSRGLMRYVATWGALYVPSMTILPKLREDRPGRGSDHEPFIAMGRPGVRFIEAVESPNAGTVASHQHSPNDLPMYVTPEYTVRVAQIVAAVAASLARAPDAPGSIAVTGDATGPKLTWTAPIIGAIDHYFVAARPVSENFYHSRVRVDGKLTNAAVTPAGLGVDATQPYFVSVAAVDPGGHESLFAYPEFRCDPSGCVVPTAALNITSTK
jgi:Peptidase family M28